jgi:thiamine biosynthesis lipoprotein
VGLRHPRQPDRRLGVVRLQEEALSASGDYEQCWEVEGRRYSHILDPRTGFPAQGIWSAWARAPEAALADALSTAFFVLGVEGTRRYCQTHREVEAALVPATEGEAELVWIGRRC